MSTETRLIDLEARIAYQDQAISDLSKEVYLQQRQIDQIESTCKYLLEQSQRRPAANNEQGDEQPPHY